MFRKRFLSTPCSKIFDRQMHQDAAFTAALLTESVGPHKKKCMPCLTPGVSTHASLRKGKKVANVTPPLAALWCLVKVSAFKLGVGGVAN